MKSIRTEKEIIDLILSEFPLISVLSSVHKTYKVYDGDIPEAYSIDITSATKDTSPFFYDYHDYHSGIHQEALMVFINFVNVNGAINYSSFMFTYEDTKGIYDARYDSGFPLKGDSFYFKLFENNIELINNKSVAFNTHIASLKRSWIIENIIKD